MQVKLQGVCRGEGLVYAKVRFDDCDADDQLFLECFSEAGNWLPSRLHGSGREALAILPLVQGRYLTLAFFAADASGRVETTQVRLGMVRTALESKGNRLIRPALVDEIGRIERAHAPEQMDIRFGPSAPAAQPGMLTMHASVQVGFRERLEPQITVLDSSSKPVDVNPVVHTDCVRSADPEGTGSVRVIAFSFVVPEMLGSLVVIVRDRVDERLWGFRALEPATFDAARRAANEMRTDASLDPRYDAWFRSHRVKRAELARQSAESAGSKLKFSIVVPLYRTPVALFDEMCASVCAQSYGNWELVLVNATPDDTVLSRAVADALRADERIRCVPLDGNRGIVGNTNAGIDAATGDYVCFLDHDDTLEPDALYEYARAIGEHPGCAMLYCDEDKILADGRHVDGFFKPDFNIDRLRAHNYLCHFLCIERAMLDSIERSAARHEGAQDHDLALKVAERSDAIHHVRKVLYHWRVVEGSTAATGADTEAPKPYATDAGHLAISEHLSRLGIAAEVLPTAWPYTHRVKYLVQGEPLVSIVIPNKDASDLLERCISSILGKTAYANFEIVVVENNSTDERTFEYYRRIEHEDERVRVVTWPSSGFNYSAIVNFGVAEARGEYLLLLNNDTEVIDGDWLEVMLGACQREDVGAVGAKLLFKDGSIQHAGVVIGGGELPAYHLYSLLPENCTGHFLQTPLASDFSAVTAACMMTSRKAYEAVGGLDEELVVLYNDVDYCLKLRERGLLVMYEPTARLYHHESATRGDDYDTPEKKARALAEADLLRTRWHRYYDEGDPFFNPHLTAPYSRLRVH